MFMVKNEFANTIDLLKVRMALQKKPIAIIALFFAVIFVGVVVINIYNATRYSEVLRWQHFSEISVWVFLTCYVVAMRSYRSSNDRLSVFPQTKKSRYVSWLLFGYIITILIFVGILLAHLLHHGALWLLVLMGYDIRFALGFDIVFLIVGCLVYIAYAFLFIAFIELIGAILRKWRIYAIMVFTLLASLIIANFFRFADAFFNMLEFLTSEPSLLNFFLKAAGLWVLMTALALIINHFTVYHKSHGPILQKGTVVGSVILVAVMVIILPLSVGFFDAEEDSYYSTSTFDEDYWDEWDSLWNQARDELQIDISHLPRGSSINVVGENTEIFRLRGERVLRSRGLHKVVIVEDFFDGVDGFLDDIQADTLLLSLSTPWAVFEGVEVFQSYGNPQLTVRLVDDTLYINYTVENPYVVVLPIWSIANRQFDHFNEDRSRPRIMSGFGRMWNGMPIPFVTIWIIDAEDILY